MAEPVEHELDLRDSEQYVAETRLRKRWKRSMGLAHGRTQKELLGETAYEGKPLLHRARDYLKIQVIQWIWHYLKSRFGGKWRFPDYSPYEGDDGIYFLSASAEKPEADEPVRISLVGDWGSGTKEALEVARCVVQDSPHFTIHLGDVYYVGTKTEIKENMLGGRVQWPIGTRGSFALNANHEMYARGKGYFQYLLPALGIRRDSSGDFDPQKTSFVCLKNDHWLVIGLDTGYYSVGVPILEKIFKPSAKLHSKLLDWLRKDVKLQDDHQRGVILLSHHQYYSQFESRHERPAKQLARLIDRPVLWFWGHEHRFAIYGKHATRNAGLQAYGRCVGHGGLPIEDIVDAPKGDRKHRVGLVIYDRRERDTIGRSNTSVGYNGYANLVFEGRKLSVEYKDTQQLLVRETWEVGDDGVLKGKSIEQLVEDDGLVLHAGARVSDAQA